LRFIKEKKEEVSTGLGVEERLRRYEEELRAKKRAKKLKRKGLTDEEIKKLEKEEKEKAEKEKEKEKEKDKEKSISSSEKPADSKYGDKPLNNNNESTTTTNKKRRASVSPPPTRKKAHIRNKDNTRSSSPPITTSRARSSSPTITRSSSPTITTKRSPSRSVSPIRDDDKEPVNDPDAAMKSFMGFASFGGSKKQG